MVIKPTTFGMLAQYFANQATLSGRFESVTYTQVKLMAIAMVDFLCMNQTVVAMKTTT